MSSLGTTGVSPVDVGGCIPALLWIPFFKGMTKKYRLVKRRRVKYSEDSVSYSEVLSARGRGLLYPIGMKEYQDSLQHDRGQGCFLSEADRGLAYDRWERFYCLLPISGFRPSPERQRWWGLLHYDIMELTFVCH